MKKIIASLLFLFFISNIFGQQLKISNGEKEKTLNTNGIYEIVIGNGEVTADDKFCNCSILTGTIVSSTKDSLQLNVTDIQNYQLIDKVSFSNSFLPRKNSIASSIAKNDVQRIKYYKSAKSKKRKNGIFLGLGGILLTTGIVTAANRFAVSDKASKRKLTISGGIQFGVGLTLLSLTGTRKYNFKEKEKPWRFY